MINQPKTIFEDNPQESKKVEGLKQAANRGVLRIRTVFPFKFFTDDLIVDQTKVSHIHRVFFLSEQVKSILIENIRSVSISCGPLFSILSIEDNVLSPNIIKIKPVKKSEAIKAQNIIQGLMLEKKEKITSSTIVNQNTSSLEDIGKIER